MPNKCPYCGNESMQKIEPPVGDSLFIGSCDSKNGSIFVDKGIKCDAYICTNCGNIQLRAPKS